MRKSFLFSALLISAMSFAQVNWYDVVEPINSIAQGTTAYENVQVNAAGNILLTGQIGSVGMDPHAVIFGDTVATVAFKENAANMNKAPFFANVNKDGDVQWLVVCNDGNFASYATLPLADGGAIVAATAYQSQQSVISFASHYTPANNAKYQQPRTQYGVVLKIAADGKPAILAQIEQAAAGKTDGIAFRDIVTDGSNFYVLANIKSAVKVGTTELAPTAAGQCLAILKFNDEGKYQGILMTDGIAVTSSTAKLVYANNKLYVTSTFKGVTGKNLTLGTASVASPNTLNNIAVMVANTDLTGEAIYVIAGEEREVNSKKVNTITTYDVLVNANNLYVSGFFAGAIAYGETALENVTGQNKAFIVRLNLTAGKADKAVLFATGTAMSSFQVDGLLQKDDSLYAYYYDWGATGDRVFLQALNADLELGSRLGLIKTGTTCATRGAAFVGDDLIYTYYAPKGKSTLSADETIVIEPTAFRGLIVSQKIFGTTPTPVPAVKNEAKKVRKTVRNGNVFVIDGLKVYSINGQRVK